ncbi:EF-hand domain-containing protein [Aliiroseovarius marinus]|uniref:EF-hand domain-containing protein n=1 Tax=Aliiroseovarius marinus TaxID=2500159 RepID=UPI003D7C8B86
MRSLRLLFLSLFVTMYAPMAMAQQTSLSSQVVQDMLDALPGPSIKRLTKDPARFIEEGTMLILGYGQDGSIGVQGIENYIALKRAKVRAREIRRFDLADLNGDGQITRAELDVLMATERASARGRLLIGFTKSDLNEDGILTDVERRAYGEAKALEEVDEDEEEILKSILKLDQDDDGRLSIPEMIVALEMLEQKV